VRRFARALATWFRRPRHIVLAAIAVVVIGLIAWGNSSPWPSAVVIRAVFESSREANIAELNRHLPDELPHETLDVPYGDEGSDTTLDIFWPEGTTDALPTVVWIHGGAWISGDKVDVAPYLRILAAEGYTTIGLNYTVAPEAVYPTAVRQLNDALDYVVGNAAELHVDTDRIVLAGDSAGAQLASQLAAMITNPDYAHLVGIEPALRADQLVGAVLNCGVYDLDGMAKLNGLVSWGFKSALWAYTGTKDWSAEAPGALMSSLDFATADFPATWISGGNADGLTWLESVPMANRLEEQGVDVTRVFYAADHTPALAHEYQFHLDSDDAQDALVSTIAFLDRVTTE
jgi:acetyl esterase/lipase